MSRLAKKLGISDVALAKACRRGKVPTPGLGYWAKLRYGKAVGRPSLPDLEAGTRDIVLIEPPEASKGPRFVEIEAKLRAERQANATIVVTKSLANAHPIVRNWLQKASGSLSSVERRRLRILNTLLKELTQRGYAVSVDPNRQHYPRVKIDDEIVDFWLKERHKQLRIRVDPEKRRYAWEPEWRTEFQPTGQLVLTIDSWTTGIRKQWSDAKTRRLEDQLNDVIAGLITAAAAFRRQRLEREERERKWRAEEERRRQLEQVRREKQEELQRLLQEVEAWQRANLIRNYVRAKLSAIPSDPELDDWATWASGLADEVDPLKRPGAGDRI